VTLKVLLVVNILRNILNFMSEKKVWIPQDPTDVELWYESLEDLTFKTKFISLPFRYAEAIVRYQECEEDMNQEDKDIIQKLTEQLTNTINEFEGEKSAFVRLSTLSPKDATLQLFDKLMGILKEEMESTPEERNREVMALNTAIYKACRVYTGEDAMLLFKKSTRVLGHLKDRLKSKDNETWNMNIVVRQWNTIKPQFEFRGFVFNNELNALTHYYKFLYVEEVVQNKDKIEELIRNYFNKIKSRLEHIGSYAIDFHIDIEKEEVLIIELNPFKETLVLVYLIGKRTEKFLKERKAFNFEY